ncbi:MAG: hypothetical protein AOA65_2182 [Candidatus Bathyarchaeota archaeon BA1]|nr:MAG: hypothetical protein AOA65_2182 [Candidatus Bathyarchaeota archaeon BA1]
MTKVAVEAAEIYKELRNLVSEARKCGMEDSGSYRKLVNVLNELASALHAMLYIDKKLDPEVEEKVKEALNPPT